MDEAPLYALGCEWGYLEVNPSECRVAPLNPEAALTWPGGWCPLRGQGLATPESKKGSPKVNFPLP